MKFSSFLRIGCVSTLLSLLTACGQQTPDTLQTDDNQSLPPVKTQTTATGVSAPAGSEATGTIGSPASTTPSAPTPAQTQTMPQPQSQAQTPPAPTQSMGSPSPDAGTASQSQGTQSQTAPAPAPSAAPSVPPMSIPTAPASPSDTSTGPTSQAAPSHFSQTVSYDTPAGSDTVGFAITATHGIITEVTVTPSTTAGGASRMFQERFRDTAPSQIIGQPISGLSVHAIGGASLTTSAFAKFVQSAIQFGIPTK